MLLPRASQCFLIILLFISLAVLTYGGSLRNQFVTWDDTTLITANPTMQGLSVQNIRSAFTSYDPELYIPFTLLSYQINYELGGLNPAIYHATDLLLHTGNSLLVSLFLWMLLGDGIVAIVLGLIFLVHPLNTEAVAWASARKDTLSTLFFLLSLISYLQYRVAGVKKWIVASVALFLCGLLSKVMIISLPIILVLLDYYEGRKDMRTLILEKVPYFLLAVVFGVVALFGKATVLESTTLLQKILMAGVSTLFYIWKSIVPVGLSVMYPFNGDITLRSPLFLFPMIFLSVTGMYLTKKRTVGRSYFFGFLLYFITLMPTFSNFAKGGNVYFASDRYAYIPLIGLLFVLGTVILRFKHMLSRLYRVAIPVITITVFSFLAATQAQVWSSSEDLYRNAVLQYPDAEAAQNNLGLEYLNKGSTAESINYFNRAIAIRYNPYAHLNKGAAYEKLGDLSSALSEYKLVVQKSPDIPDSYYGLGSIAAKQRQLHEAVIFYKKTLALKPDHTNALNNLGAAYIALQEWDRAIEVYLQTIALHPDFPEAYYNLGGSYEAKGMLAEAKKAYLLALHYAPNDPDTLERLQELMKQ